MGLFANEKANGTDELLMTSPIRIWDIVLGKYLAGAAFVLIMTAIVAFFPAILFFYGDPEWGKTASGLLGRLAWGAERRSEPITGAAELLNTTSVRSAPAPFE